MNLCYKWFCNAKDKKGVEFILVGLGNTKKLKVTKSLYKEMDYRKDYMGFKSVDDRLVYVKFEKGFNLCIND